MNYNKKGQAAMEFLMTYGWAILAAIVVIAVLAIYFRPQQIIGTATIFNAPINGVSESISAANDEVLVEIRNAGGGAMDNIAITADINSPSGDTCTPTLTANSDGTGTDYLTTPWNAGDIAFITCDLDTDVSAGDSVGVDFSISFTSGGGTLPKISTGTVSGKAV